MSYDILFVNGHPVDAADDREDGALERLRARIARYVAFPLRTASGIERDIADTDILEERCFRGPLTGLWHPTSDLVDAKGCPVSLFMINTDATKPADVAKAGLAYDHAELVRFIVGRMSKEPEALPEL